MTKLIAFSSAEISNEKGEVICRSTGTFMVHRADA
jgi:acyl-coenzyme A thioesterase PaaI-like protein